jgi:hypothetical protein
MQSHLPFGDKIDWNLIPQVSEADFTENPASVLKDLFAKTGLDQPYLHQHLLITMPAVLPLLLNVFGSYKISSRSIVTNDLQPIRIANCLLRG